MIFLFFFFLPHRITYLHKFVLNSLYILSVGPEEHILQSMCGTIGCGDETEEEEDQIWDAKYIGQLLMDHLLPKWHLLLGVPSKPVPADNILHRKKKVKCEVGQLI